MSIQAPRGTRDILPASQAAWFRVKAAAEKIALQMGYQPITVPTYEELGLFQRSIGAGTDIMDKELFLVKGIRAEADASPYALRPEGTAGIVRAYIQHGMHTLPQPVRLFSIVNLFRYDRPQKGRYREHVQFDIEVFGSKGAFADAWVIYTTWNFLRELGLNRLQLKLNSLGTKEERQKYIEALQTYYLPHKDSLSADSQQRLDGNPLRILDSKNEADKQINQDAPRLSQFLTPESLTHFESVQAQLTAWKIPFALDPFLVRGLDYYCHTAFEWTVQNKEGQQDSLGGGGRYDGLVTQLGGPDVGGVGAGLGLDRIIEEMENQGLVEKLELPKTSVYLVAADAAGRQKALELAETLLQKGIYLDLNLDKEGMGAQMKGADRSGAALTIIVGTAEVESGKATVKKMDGSGQESIEFSQLSEYCLSHS